jgi:hypothetical protein
MFFGEVQRHILCAITVSEAEKLIVSLILSPSPTNFVALRQNCGTDFAISCNRIGLLNEAAFVNSYLGAEIQNYRKMPGDDGCRSEHR